jgi:toxin-antitoxin system PIN domain toxin
VTTLLDANVLIALVVADHIHHTAAEDWLAQAPDRVATCPTTQGALVRLLVRQGQAVSTAVAVVAALADDPRHEFWPNDVPFHQVSMQGVIGHRQVTDAYLAQLARAHQGRLATFDEGLAKMHDDIVDLVPVR